MSAEKSKLQDYFENPDRVKSQDSLQQSKLCAASTVDVASNAGGDVGEINEFAMRMF
jgi:hypothetical protein